MKISIASDHSGVEHKKAIISMLQDLGHKVENLGTDTEESVDYPSYAHKLAEKVLSKEAEFGIILCGTGNGVAMTANKHQGIRAGLAWNYDVAALIRQHGNSNILVIPARFTSIAEAKEITRFFLATPFEGGRHQKRLDMICI